MACHGHRGTLSGGLHPPDLPIPVDRRHAEGRRPGAIAQQIEDFQISEEAKQRSKLKQGSKARKQSEEAKQRSQAKKQSKEAKLRSKAKKQSKAKRSKANFLKPYSFLD